MGSMFIDNVQVSPLRGVVSSKHQSHRERRKGWISSAALRGDGQEGRTQMELSQAQGVELFFALLSGLLIWICN